MRKTTLERFLKTRKPGLGGLDNAHVRFPGFSTLYVRYTRRYINGEVSFPVLDLASMDARTPGKGAFTNLHDWLRAHHPELWLYVENVLSDRFRRKLLRMGYTPLEVGESHCFFMRPVDQPLDRRFTT